MAEDGSMTYHAAGVALAHRMPHATDLRAPSFAPPALHQLHGRRGGMSSYRLHRSEPVGGQIKQGFDMAVAALLLLFLSPLLLIVAAIIRLESKGPALFRQDRSGFRGRPFEIYKFRTMTVQETGAVVQAAQRNDARVTRFGAFLRKSSIDELPQLINVLKGEMSFIGPRPHAVAHDRKFSKICRDYPKRFAARPGISGLAQISGSRGSIETDEQLIQRVAFDLEYIERWSFMFDLMIIWKTVVHVAGSKDAY